MYTHAHKNPHICKMVTFKHKLNFKKPKKKKPNYFPLPLTYKVMLKFLCVFIIPITKYSTLQLLTFLMLAYCKK